MHRLAATIFASCLALAAPASAHAPEPDVSKKLAYVAGVSPERIYYCRVTPQTDATNQTQMLIDLSLSGEGPVEAQMVVTGSVRGELYRARISWRGVAGASGDEGKDALIVLNEVAAFDADPLPGAARWSDPSGDTITLRVDPHLSKGPQAYELNGTQVTELGTNDLYCLDGDRPKR